MSDSKNRDSRHDDIDLLALVERSLAFFKKYKWLFITAAVAGLLLGYIKYRSLPVLYKSRLVLQSILLSNQNNIQIATNWSNLLKNREYTQLAVIFNCSGDLIKNLKEIKPEEIQKIFTPDNPNGFFLDVKVSDAAILGELQKGIVHGFNNHESARDRLTAKRNRLQELIYKTGDEIRRLDSVKRTLGTIIRGEKPGSSLIIDPSGISRQLIEMNEKHLFYKDELKFTTAVEVLQSFNKFKDPVRHSLPAWLFIGLVPCLVIAYVIAFFHSINQKLNERSRTRIET
jgi:hypothetical protein